MEDWFIEARSYGSCNCAYGCPCQFEALPTEGNCRGFECFEITKGHFGDTDLTGQRAALFYAWPGPIFEGKGEMQIILDESADEAQRVALEKVLRGEETKEAATHWWVFREMSDTVYPTLVRPIELDIDIDARTARVEIPGVVTSTGSPIQPPHSDAPHRARIVIPDGIEFEEAEMGDGVSETGSDAAIRFDSRNSYAQFNMIRHAGGGVVHG